MGNKFKKGDKVKLNGLPLTRSKYTEANRFSKDLESNTVYIIDDIFSKEKIPCYYLKDMNCFHPEDIFELAIDTKSGMVGSEWDDAELFKTQSGLDKVIVVNPTKIDFTEEFNRLTEPKAPIEYSEIDNNLFTIFNKDLDFYCELERLIKYLASTYSDKYESTDNYSKRKLLSKEGKAANIFTALKYIQRYDTVGYSKSENPQDLLKAVHYLLFENQRKTKHGN